VHLIHTSLRQALKQAVQRRGVPYKLYTDQGKPFTNKHTQIICANLGIRLLHAKPYAAWSKGKIERCFYTLQQGFESTLKLPDNRAQSLEELNAKLTHWVQTVYHLRPHGSTGVSPQFRFAQAAGAVRQLEAGLELEALFFTRITRTVRKDGTVRIEGKLYEVDLSLRALEVELRFDPYRRDRMEVYHRGKACGRAAWEVPAGRRAGHASAHAARAGAFARGGARKAGSGGGLKRERRRPGPASRGAAAGVANNFPARPDPPLPRR